MTVAASEEKPLLMPSRTLHDILPVQPVAQGAGVKAFEGVTKAPVERAQVVLDSPSI
jgi:hypothetical protein